MNPNHNVQDCVKPHSPGRANDVELGRLSGCRRVGLNHWVRELPTDVCRVCNRKPGLGTASVLSLRLRKKKTSIEYSVVMNGVLVRQYLAEVRLLQWTCTGQLWRLITISWRGFEAFICSAVACGSSIH